MKKKSDTLYAQILGSVREEITSTFKEFEKLIAYVRTPAAPISHPSPIASAKSVPLGSPDIVEGLSKSEVGTASSDSEQEESRGEKKMGHRNCLWMI